MCSTLDRRAQRVVRQHHHRAGVDEGRRDEAVVALVQRAPVAAVDVDAAPARRGALAREDVEPLASGVAVGEVEHRRTARARGRRARPIAQDGRMLRDARRGCCTARRTMRGGIGGLPACRSGLITGARRRPARPAVVPALGGGVGCGPIRAAPRRSARRPSTARCARPRGRAGPRCPSGSCTARCRRPPTARGAGGRATAGVSGGASGSIACSRMRTRWPRRYGSSSSRPARSSAHCSSASCAAARNCGSNSLKRGKVCTNSSCTRSRPLGLSEARLRTGPSELSTTAVTSALRLGK